MGLGIIGQYRLKKQTLPQQIPYSLQTQSIWFLLVQEDLIRELELGTKRWPVWNYFPFLVLSSSFSKWRGDKINMELSSRLSHYVILRESRDGVCWKWSGTGHPGGAGGRVSILQGQQKLVTHYHQDLTVH